MTHKKALTTIEKEFGRRLTFLRIKAGFIKQEDFGKAFNGGKIHKDISAYAKGKNVQFRTMIRFAHTLRVELPVLLDFENRLPIVFLDSLPTLQEMMLNEGNRFAENIKSLREQTFRTQLDFEQEIGIVRENLTNYERGIIKPNLVTIGRFAETLGVTPVRLFLPKW